MLFDFYDNMVRLAVNGDVLLERRLVAIPETGFNTSIRMEVEENNVFELNVDGVSITLDVGITPNTRMIMLNPSEPYVWLEDQDELLLLD